MLTRTEIINGVETEIQILEGQLRRVGTKYVQAQCPVCNDICKRFIGQHSDEGYPSTDGVMEVGSTVAMTCESDKHFDEVDFAVRLDRIDVHFTTFVEQKDPKDCHYTGQGNDGRLPNQPM